MRSQFGSIRQLIIQTATGQSWYFGSQIPAELIAYYAALSQTVLAVSIKRYNNTDYAYEAMIQTALGNFGSSEGHRTAAGVAADSFMLFNPSSSNATFGYANGDQITTIDIGTSTAGVLDTIRIGPSGAAGILADYSGSNDDIRLGNLNNHVIVDNPTDTILIETDDKIQINAHGGSRTGVSIEALRHVNNQQDTLSTRALTTYANLTNIAGVAFVAPLSGIVTLVYTAQMANSDVTGGSALTPWVGTGTTVGSGTEVLAANDTNALILVQHATAGEAVRFGGQFTLSGLTAGDDYNVSMRGRAITAGTASFLRIHTTVIPSP